FVGLIQILVEVVVDAPCCVLTYEPAVLDHEAEALIDRGIVLPRVHPAYQLMSGKPEEVGAHPAFAGKERAVEVVEARGTGFSGSGKNRGCDDCLIDVRGRQHDRSRAQARIWRDESNRVEAEGRVEELNVSLAVGEFVHITPGGVELSE